MKVYEIVNDVTQFVNSELPDGWTVKEKALSDMVKTYCCSATPMVYVQPLRYEVLPPDGEEMNDEMYELEELLNECLADPYYLVWWQLKEDELEHADFESMNDAIEYHNGNHVF